MLESALQIWEPRPAVRVIDWALEHGWNEFGKPYNDLAYPHLSAPGGPFDAFDCPSFFDIWLQWASRLGKTFGGQIVMLKQAACDPCPMMFAAPDEKLATEIVERTYSMIDRCAPLAELLPPPHRRKQSRINLRFSRVYVAWSRSESTLADKSARFIHNAEIDKWEHQSTSKEADPLKLSDDRAKDFPTFKRWKESTPALKQSSRVERGRLGSSNASLWVECPLCGRFQTLKFGQIRWEKNAAGKSDKALALATAHYQCGHCRGVLNNEHRGTMMRSGVWIPEGCGCDDDKAREALKVWREPGRGPWGGWKDAPWITGSPLRDGRDYGSQLSSLYALSRSWGDIAAEWVDCQKNPQNLRNFVNQWLAETWEIASRKASWTEVVARLVDLEIKRGVVPAWASMLTMAIDRQGDDRHPWVVDAWGPGRRSATIAYGYCGTLAEAEGQAKAAWPHADGGQPLVPAMVLVDSGHRPLGVYELCDRLCAAGVPAMACKGSSQALTSDYDLVTLGKNTSRQGTQLCHVDTIRSQIWVHHAIYDAEPKSAGGFCLYRGTDWEHEDFVRQLENDQPVQTEDARNNARESWERIDANFPNDYRDTKRYSYVAMLIATRGTEILPRKYNPPAAIVQQASRIRDMRIRR